METESDLFKWKHFEAPVRWYLKYSLSYRDLVEMMKERGLDMAHTTIMEGTEIRFY